MNLIHQEQYTLETTDLTMFQTLRPARLLELVQLVSGHHAEKLGLGETVLEARSLAWVVVRQKTEIRRMPRKGETLCFTTWPGRGLHGLFPRYMEISSPEGESFARLCFLWVIMDKEKREMIQPASLNLSMPFPEKEPLMPLPRLPKTLLPTKTRAVFTVPYSYVDVVGHMNNTRYLEVAENNIEAPAQGRELRDILIEYTHELRLGETMELQIGQEDMYYTLRGSRGDQTIITLCLRYE